MRTPAALTSVAGTAVLGTGAIALGWEWAGVAALVLVTVYAACSFAIGTAAGAGAIMSFGRLWIWVTVAEWLVVFVAMLRRGVVAAQGS